MNKLLFLAVAPVFIILFYIYLKDKYEREPFWLALIGLFWGFVMTAPIILVESFIEGFTPKERELVAIYNSFLVAALVEEGFKFIILYFLIKNNKEFDEGFDAIVYSVFISLGFAGCENFFYVFSSEFGGFETGLLRAFFSVPAHAFFGVCMGYYFSFSKFYNIHRKINVFFAFICAFIWHGLYDFFLLSEFWLSGLFFLVFVVYIWVSGFIKINKLIQSSPYHKDIF